MQDRLVTRFQNNLSDRFTLLSYYLFSGSLQRFGLQFAYPSFDQTAVSDGNQTTGIYPPPSYPNGNSAMAPNVEVNLQFPRVATMPTLLGKG